MKRLTGADNIHFNHYAKDGAEMGNWSIRFTGRTMLEAEVEELPYVGAMDELASFGQ